MTHTFKVGDKVRSIDPEITDTDEMITSEIEPTMSECFAESMVDLVGDVGIVIEVHPDNGYRVSFGRQYPDWNYLPEWLELVDPANPVG